MAAKNEMLIAGGVVALGLAYYLFFADDAEAAEVPPKFPPGPTPLPGPPSPTVFVSTRCPSIEADLPDENKKHVDESIAAGLSSAEYGALAQEYMAQGWTEAAKCLAAAQVIAAVKEGKFTKVPGGNSVDQTMTCAFWVGQYNHAKGMLEKAIASSFASPPNMNAAAEITAANSTMNAAKNAIAQLGGCGVVLP